MKTLALGKKKFDVVSAALPAGLGDVCDSTLFLQTLLLCMSVDGIMVDCS